ncbi:MAG: hypothetical protein L6Q92_12055 [Phycisphaerae bacterium]|nr:hypothetical protein [Phycisphaerae bacterium]
MFSLTRSNRASPEDGTSRNVEVRCVVRDAMLCIEWTTERVGEAQIAAALDLATRAFAAAVVRGVVFDFARVRCIGPAWTVALARLIDFQRRCRVACRIVGLAGQPAAVVALYGRNVELRSLVATARSAA